MKVTWLGQAGLLLETDEIKIMVDPYLSDSVAEINPANFRRVPVDERFFDIKPDIMIFTHSHLDHYDPQTVERFLTPESKVTVLAPSSVWDKVRKYGAQNNCVLFDRHTVWSHGSALFSAVKAQHSDEFAIGVIIEIESKKYYITGDTLYSTDIFGDIPDDIYALFLPVNGVGNNMNMTDAARFADKIGAQKVVPLHIGLFDNLSAADFICENKVIPTIYEEVDL